MLNESIINYLGVMVMKKDVIEELKIKMVGVFDDFKVDMPSESVDFVLNSNANVKDLEMQSHSIIKILMDSFDSYADVVFWVKKTNYAMDRVSLQKAILYISKFRTDHIIKRYNLNIKEVV